MMEIRYFTKVVLIAAFAMSANALLSPTEVVPEVELPAASTSLVSELSPSSHASCSLPSSSCAENAAKSREEVRHVILLSGPRHGSSFTMSLLADNPNAIYLGELMNGHSPMAHAPIVNKPMTLAVMKELNRKLPGAKLTGHQAHNLQALKNNLSTREGGEGRIVKNQAETRRVLEDFAISKGKSVLLYKFLSNNANDWLESVVQERCTHLILLQRNFLQTRVSALNAHSKSGGFVGVKTSGKVELNLEDAAHSMLKDMHRNFDFTKMLMKNNQGASALVQFHEITDLEETKHLKWDTAVRRVKKMYDGRLNQDLAQKMNKGPEATKEDTETLAEVTGVPAPLVLIQSPTAHAMCAYHVSDKTCHLYRRQDSRDELEPKVTNYLQLKSEFGQLCAQKAKQFAHIRKADPSAELYARNVCSLPMWQVPE